MSQHHIFQYTDPEIDRIFSDTSEEHTPDTPILSGNGSFLLGEKSLSIDPENRTITLDLGKAYHYIPHYKERILTDREIFAHLSSCRSGDYVKQTEEINTLLKTGVGGMIESPHKLKLSFTEIPIFDGKYIAITIFPENHHTFPGGMKIPSSLHFDRTPFQSKKDITQSTAEIVSEVNQKRNPTNIPLIGKKGNHLFPGVSEKGLWRVTFVHGKGNPAILKDCLAFLDSSTGAFEIIRIKHQPLPDGGIDALEPRKLSTHPNGLTAIVDLEKLSQCFLDLTEGDEKRVDIPLIKKNFPSHLPESVFPLDTSGNYPLSLLEITPVFRVFLENYSKNIHTLADWIRSRQEKVLKQKSENAFEKIVSSHLQSIFQKAYSHLSFEEKKRISFGVSVDPKDMNIGEKDYREWIRKHHHQNINIEPDGIIWNSQENTYTLIESKKTKNLQNAKEQLFRYRYLSDFVLLEKDGQSFSGNGVYAIVDDVQGKINPPGGVKPIFLSEMNAEFFQKLSKK